LSVVLIRKGHTEQAIEVLKKAIAIAPNNAYAHRNLGASFMKLNKMDDGIIHLRRATELKPDDQQAWFGLAQALELKGDKSEADAAFLRVIDIDAQTPLAEQARSQRRKYAEESFRESTRTTPRMDAVMYLVGALEKFNGMKTSEIEKIAFEIGKLGQTGLDVNNSDQKYRLRTLPGQFSGLHLVCLMYAAFKILNPSLDIGMDFSQEYQMAKTLYEKK
jgi:tetratricopeptide (TPR) repeat protein